MSIYSLKLLAILGIVLFFSVIGIVYDNKQDEKK
ncbi:hypothetical protein EFP_132 [Enterococcus phage EF24C]|uniref:Uncharacterized protein n=1 Tax=Enterococcus phage phiEF24C TaxID=442493 RepID=A8E2I4_BPPHE|nr:hypothetical protein EFP_gp132 [Enterococcus phage EF24C]BAF81400.1 hypothetical protein EFP_132 [Enterococcus phage EF24C]